MKNCNRLSSAALHILQKSIKKLQLIYFVFIVINKQPLLKPYIDYIQTSYIIHYSDDNNNNNIPNLTTTS